MVGADHHTVPDCGCLGARLGKVLKESHEGVVADDAAVLIVDRGVVEEERGQRIHPGSGQHVPPEDQVPRMLLGPVPPPLELVGGYHVRHAG